MASSMALVRLVQRHLFPHLEAAFTASNLTFKPGGDSLISAWIIGMKSLDVRPFSETG